MIGIVRSRASRVVPTKFGDTVMTSISFSVERALAGDLQVGGVTRFEIEGGAADGIGIIAEGEPRMPLGSRYLLFLQQRKDPLGPAILAFYRLPGSKRLPALPSGTDLSSVWAATCTAHPEGIYYYGPKVHLVIPAGVLKHAALTQFEVALPTESERVDFEQ